MGWIGGKRALRKAILEQFPQDITRYIEVSEGQVGSFSARTPATTWRFSTTQTEA